MKKQKSFFYKTVVDKKYFDEYINDLIDQGWYVLQIIPFKITEMGHATIFVLVETKWSREPVKLSRLYKFKMWLVNLFR